MHKEPQVVGPYPNSPYCSKRFTIRSSAGHAKLIFIHVESPIAGQHDRRHYDSYSQVLCSARDRGGGRVVVLQNANGVVLKLSGPAIGLEASLSLSGMTIIYASSQQFCTSASV